ALIVATIEPCLHGFWRSCNPLFKSDDRFFGRLQTVVGDRQKGAVQFSLVLVEDLDDVPVRRRVRELEDIRSRAEYLPRKFYELVKGKHRLLVPLACPRQRQHHHEHTSEDECGNSQMIRHFEFPFSRAIRISDFPTAPESAGHWMGILLAALGKFSSR